MGPNDCTALGCNLDSAFAAAIADCEASLAGAPDRAGIGCKIYIPAGDHTVTAPVTTGSDPGICRAYSFEGRGGMANRRALTRIHAADVTVFRGLGFGYCRSVGKDAGTLEIKGLGIEYASGPKATPVIAIDMEAPVRIENVWIRYPSIGLRIHADADGSNGFDSGLSYASNANVSRIWDLTTEYTRHAGVWVDGSDTNAGAFIGLNINTACYATGTEMAGLEAEFGDCAGLEESSFLGNFVVASHFGIAAGHPDFRFTAQSNHGTCLGCYVEGPDAPDLDARWSQWIGGLGPVPTGSGFRLDGPRAYSLDVENRKDPANVTNFRMGLAANEGGVYWKADHVGDGSSWPLRLHWVPASTNYRYDIGNVSVGRVWEIEGYYAAPEPSTVLGHVTYYDPEVAECVDSAPICQ
ncbi:MAG: hypothetical protein KC933_17165 [Myxococcales bacterium]|nr:hypothetical protein [Myxococcales bacterium]MCB9649428.1 hypothetical protein [Deltaproteobacteria bacterium]